MVTAATRYECSKSDFIAAGVPAWSCSWLDPIISAGGSARSTAYEVLVSAADQSRGSSPRHIWTAPSLLLLFLFEVLACLQLLFKLNQIQRIASSSPVLTAITCRSRYSRTARARYQSSRQPASSTQASTKPTAKMAHAMSDDQVCSPTALLRQQPPHSTA
jgi:hypothetical protein